MAFRLFTPLLLVFALFLYLAYLNPGSTPFVYAPGKQISMPHIALVMISFAVGALCLSLLYFLRSFGDLLSDIRNSIEKMKERRIGNKLLKAEQTAAEGKTPKALNILEKLLSAKPDNFKALMMKGKLLRRIGETEEALRAHSLALALNPADTGTILQLKDDYRSIGQWKSAYNMLEQLRGRSPKDISLIIEMRELSEKLKDYKRAIVLQRETLKLVTDENEQKEGKRKLADLYCLNAQQLAGEEKLPQAKKELASAGKIQPGFIPAVMMQCDLALRQQSRREAEKILRKEFKSTGSLILLRRLGEMYSAEGEIRKVEELYRWGLSYQPKGNVLHLFIAMSQIKNSDFKGALETLMGIEKTLGHLTVYNLARGIARIKLESNGAPGEESFNKALEDEWSKFLRYRCTLCGMKREDYFPECPACGKWNSAAFVSNRTQ